MIWWRGGGRLKLIAGWTKLLREQTDALPEHGFVIGATFNMAKMFVFDADKQTLSLVCQSCCPGSGGESSPGLPIPIP